MKTLIGVVLVMLAGNALAVGWGVQTHIEGYYVWDAGAAHIKTSSNQNPDGCQSSQYLTIDTSTTNFKSIWAQVIAAHTSNQTVSLFYDGCLGPYPRVRAVAIPNVW